MGSIPPSKKSKEHKLSRLLDEAAHAAALRFVLPWDLERLWQEGKQGIEEAFTAVDRIQHHRINPEALDQFAEPYVHQAAERAGRRIKSGRTTYEPTTCIPNDSIRRALETFSRQEWPVLIVNFDRRDLDTLRSYLSANEESLKTKEAKGVIEGWSGASDFNTLSYQVAQRDIALFAEQPSPRISSIDNALLAAYIRDYVRRCNVEGKPRPSAKRSMAETGSDRAIAEGLTLQGLRVTPYQVKMMLRRIDQTPFEEFDGSSQEYILWLTDPKDYRRLSRRTEPGRRRPQRDPDPYFSTRF